MEVYQIVLFFIFIKFFSFLIILILLDVVHFLSLKSISFLVCPNETSGMNNKRNNFIDGKSHDAMVDVEVTLKLCKALRLHDNRMWDYLINGFVKTPYILSNLFFTFSAVRASVVLQLFILYPTYPSSRIYLYL